jgi:hypothetical protein
MANDASVVATNLLAANKGGMAIDASDDTAIAAIPSDPVAAAEAYRLLMKGKK